MTGNLVVWALLSTSLGAADVAPPNPDEILQYLGKTIDWFRHLDSLDQTPLNSEELLFQDTARRSSRWILQWGFEFARAEANVLASNTKNGAPATTLPTNGSRTRNWVQSAALAAQRVKLLQKELDQINNDLEQSSATSRPALSARRDKLVAQLNLANARREALQKLAGVVTHVDGGEGSLLDKITELERSVPDAQVDQSQALTAEAGVNATSTAPPQSRHPEAAGIVGIAGEMFALTRRMSNLKDVADEADALRQTNERLIVPLRAALVDAVKRGDALSTTRESDDEEKLGADRQELDSLTARFKQLAAAGDLPRFEPQQPVGMARGALAPVQR